MLNFQHCRSCVKIPSLPGFHFYDDESLFYHLTTFGITVLREVKENV